MHTLRRAFRGAPLLLVAILASTSLGACTTTRGRADDAYAKGDYASAAKLYAEVVAGDPSDREAQANLQTARTQALSALLVTLDNERRGGRVDASLDKLDELLRARSEWSHRADARVEERITTEIAWASGLVRAEVMKLVDAGLPLRAEARLASRKVLRRAELAGRASELRSAIDGAGLKVCNRLTGETGAKAPYFTRFTAGYCTHFRAPAPGAVPLPNVVSAVDLHTSVEGLDDAQRAHFAAAASQWLSTSLWFGPSPRHALAVASGRQRAAFRVEDVSLTRPWVESVPYQATEMYQEPHQEPYTDNETYYVDTPYTDYETVYKSCGSGSQTHSCNEQRPVTKYRHEMRSRIVTKYRTAYRTKTRYVTKYRDEGRVFTFAARKHTGDYESAFTMRFDFGEGVAPFDLTSATTVQQSALEHDVSFPPASVAPSRPSLLTADGWVTARLDALGAEFATASREHWKKSFCGGASFTPESAARCAYAPSPSYPPGVRTALAMPFGEDVDEALALTR